MAVFDVSIEEVDCAGKPITAGSLPGPIGVHHHIPCCVHLKGPVLPHNQHIIMQQKYATVETDNYYLEQQP